MKKKQSKGNKNSEGNIAGDKKGMWDVRSLSYFTLHTLLDLFMTLEGHIHKGGTKTKGQYDENSLYTLQLVPKV